MASVFKFKQFVVDQRDCAMKINTDGVLLGAMAMFDDPKYILDIGTGTGVIALMLAQRFEQAQVDTVEVDESAYMRSKVNFQQSRFAARMKPYCTSFENLKPGSTYDLIVSNPPFFINSLQNPNENKTLARHTDYVFFSKLLTFCFENLTPEGSLQLVLPSNLAQEVIVMAGRIGFALERRIDIRSFENVKSIRWIVDLRKIEGRSICEEFIIYKEKGLYTENYKKLLSPFFITL